MMNVHWVKINRTLSLHSLGISTVQTLGQVWWHITIILALRRLRQEDVKFEINLGYTARIPGRMSILLIL